VGTVQQEAGILAKQVKKCFFSTYPIVYKGLPRMLQLLDKSDKGKN